MHGNITPQDKLYVSPGTVIEGQSGNKYQTLQMLGRGGNGVTLLVTAVDGLHMGLLFAAKFFVKISQEERLQRFLQEVQFLKGCQHPAIMRVFDEGIFLDRPTGRKHPFLVAEYLPNTLELAFGARSKTFQKLAYCTQLLSALKYLAGLRPPAVHRDIKPANVFLRADACVLGDFGLLKRLNNPEAVSLDDREFFVDSIEPAMNSRYRTPDIVEYVVSGRPLSAKADVFQLGLVFSELLTGFNPCPKQDYLAPIDLLPRRRPAGSFGAELLRLIEKMLNTQPDQRPTADELLPQFQDVFLRLTSQHVRIEGRAF